MTIPNFPKIITQLNNQNQNYEIIIPNPMNNYGTRGGREPQCPWQLAAPWLFRPNNTIVAVVNR